MKRDADLMDKVQQQIYLGDEGFIESVQQKCLPGGAGSDIAREQKRKPLMLLDEYVKDYPFRKEAMARAYLEGDFSQAEIARHFGVHHSTVSKAVRKHRES
jgi:DNA-directed RNA polymerase specialized sigma24 family protein